jgi:hypothetical protein
MIAESAMLGLKRMAANLESVQVFKSRCSAIGLSADGILKLENVGWTTLAKFAYMSSHKGVGRCSSLRQ